MVWDVDSCWRALQDLERRLRSPALPQAQRGSDWFDDWRARLNRVERVRQALFLSGSVAQRLVAEQLAGIDLSTITAILLSACKDVASYVGGSVLLGGAAGAAIGSLGFGVGALPGAVVGAGVGAQAGAWVMGFLGLKALVEDLGSAIPQALRHYECGMRLAWGPVRQWEADQGTDRAPGELAAGHVVLMVAMLSALVAYLTRGRGNPAAKARLLQEIRQSPRLGSKVADWLVANEEKLLRHPALRPRQQRVEMTSAAQSGGGPAATPSQLRAERQAMEHPTEKAKVEVATKADTPPVAAHGPQGHHPHAHGFSVRNINPHSPAAGGDINCVKCALAVEATLSGHPAQALPGLASPTFQGAQDILEQTFGTKLVSMDSHAGIMKAMADAGPGSRGIVIGYREGAEFSHAFNVVNQKGTVRFLDGQIGGATTGVAQYDYFWFIPTTK